ncbi:hypothetical protein Gohar_002894, partial [Gossypium harknessii]|nr:hypothetical protein [Gossypium harknessii]
MASEYEDENHEHHHEDSSTIAINQLWKPSGMMELIDLGYGFYLIKFMCGQDYDNKIGRLLKIDNAASLEKRSRFA